MSPTNRGAQVVWFKRDLRVADHAPLFEAARGGPCVCLFVYETDVIEADDFDPSHLEFINQSLAELASALEGKGMSLTVRRGQMPEVLDDLHAQVGVAALWSHQETGNAVTYARDRRVRAWAKRHRVKWNECLAHGVVRRLDSRDRWSRYWHAQMSSPLIPAPERITAVEGLEHEQRLDANALGLEASARTETQPGGESHGWTHLRSFLASRGVNYRADMSSPLSAWEGCSRLSPYLAWGNLSIRQVYQASERRSQTLRAARQRGRLEDARWLPSLKAFGERLRWHCHFIQKLEDEPDIEFQNMNRAFDGLRDAFDEQLFDAWASGQTGFPLVDACMRALHASGWINFRMRAMLVSFASYQLWLPWRPTALHLSRLFLDYEPGIHYSQIQMQSGVTGINAVRIYSPIKQVHDQDPRGEFIRRFCPELATIPDEYLSEPHRMPADVQRRCGCVIGTHYPAPIVNHATAYRTARERIFKAKGTRAAREEAARVYQKHGSRRGARGRRR